MEGSYGLVTLHTQPLKSYEKNAEMMEKRKNHVNVPFKQF